VTTPEAQELLDGLPALRLRGDKRLAATVQWAVIGLALLMSVSDVRIGGDPENIAQLIAGRFVWSAILYALIRRIAAAPDRPSLERAISLSLMFTLVGMLLVAYLRPPGNTSTSRLITMAVLFVYASFPLPRRRMMIPLFAFTFGYLAILRFHSVDVTAVDRDSIILAFIASHVVGYLIAGRREALLASEAALWTANAAAHLELTTALDAMRTLEGILPICSFCRRIRDDDDRWESLEQYVHDHSDTRFSHGLCPTCAEREYPDLTR
jgi:hypothetical protein